MVFGFNQKRGKKNNLIDFMGDIPKPEKLFDIARKDTNDFTYLGAELFSGSKPQRSRKRDYDDRLVDERESVLRSGGNHNDGFEDRMNTGGRDMFGRESKYRYDNNRIFSKRNVGDGL